MLFGRCSSMYILTRPEIKARVKAKTGVWVGTKALIRTGVKAGIGIGAQKIEKIGIKILLQSIGALQVLR